MKINLKDNNFRLSLLKNMVHKTKSPHIIIFLSGLLGVKKERRLIIALDIREVYFV